MRLGEGKKYLIVDLSLGRGPNFSIPALEAHLIGNGRNSHAQAGLPLTLILTASYIPALRPFGGT